MSRGAACPAEPPTQADQTQTRLHSELPHNDPAIELPARACSTDMQKRLASCMIRANRHGLPPTASRCGDPASIEGLSDGTQRRSARPLYLTDDWKMTCTALKFPHNDNPVVTSAAKCIVRTVPSQMLQSTVSESRADSDYFRNATSKCIPSGRLE
jgi:hypothetical protein